MLFENKKEDFRGGQEINLMPFCSILFHVLHLFPGNGIKIPIPNT